MAELPHIDDDDPDVREWHTANEKLLAKINDYPNVQVSLAKLAKYGASPEKILLFLSATTVESHSFRQEIHAKKRDLLRLKRRLLKVADELEASVRSPLTYPRFWFQLLSPGFANEHHFRDRDPGVTLSIALRGMRHQAAACGDLGSALGRLLRTESETARKTYLICLMLYVRAATGKPHYPILADLLDAADAVSGGEAGRYSPEVLKQIWKRDKGKRIGNVTLLLGLGQFESQKK